MPWLWYLLNAALPGAVLFVEGCWIRALVLLIPGLLALAAMPVSWWLLADPVGVVIVGYLAACYAIMAVIATILLALRWRQQNLDEQAIRSLHAQASIAYLNGETETAENAAQELVGKQSRLAGAWRLLSVVGMGGNQSRAAKKKN